MIGKTVLHYKITGQLGQGGMGVVYRAEDTRLGRTVALKFVSRGAVGTEGECDRLLAEARSAAALSHPNICTIYGVEETEGDLFIAMQYFPGETLAARIERERVPVAESVEIVTALAEGLREAHAKGIVHRDIKSANIAMSERGPVLLDFGLARSVSSTAVTQAGVTVGTPQTMSPEQARGEGVDGRTDIWALGVVWYEMLTGRPPFAGDYPMAVIYAILNEDPLPPSQRYGDIPAGVDRVILKMLAKDVDARYRDASALLRDLRAIDTDEAPAAAPDAPPSIAVLPFENMSTDPEQEYFCDGIADDVINDLTRIEGLQVAARTTSFAYKGRKEDIRKVGREIGVGTVLEGSVRKAGKRVRITAQLINVETGYHVWSERYDRDLEDVFAIQEEIARKIVDALRVELSDEEDRDLATPDTTSIEAYDLYLRGREALLRLTANYRLRARDYFEEAIAKDPNFARAYAGLAYFFVMGHMYFKTQTGMIDKAIAAAKRAIELDPGLAEAHVAMGYIASAQERYDDAEASFQKALAINPSLYEAHYYRGRCCFAKGDLDTALKSFERAASVDPTDFQTWALISSIHEGAGRADLAMLAANQAIERATSHLELHPDNARAAYMCAGSMFSLGRKDEAVEWLEKAVAIAPDDPGVVYNVACLYSRMGQLDKSLAALNKSIDAGFSQSTWVQHDPDLENLRHHPAFPDVLKRLA